MSRCIGCNYAFHDQFEGYPGRWICMHPFRGEISNKGDFTYPKIAKPRRIICQTTVDDYSNLANQRVTLKDAKTPIWCYLDVVDRAKKEMPGFDPDRQRAILYP